MAKANARRRRTRDTDNTDVQIPELSLEEILAEFRAQESAPEPEPAEPEAESIELQPEGDGVLTGGLSEPGPEQPEEPAEREEPAQPEAGEETTQSELPPSPENAGREEAPGTEEPDLPVPPSLQTGGKAPVPAELLESFEEDDFYAGYSEERDKPAAEETEKTGEEPSAGEEAEEEEAQPARKKKRSPRDSIARRAPSGGSPLSALWGKLVALAAAVSVKRERSRTAPPPEIEDEEVEMEPRKAANHYAAQLPSLKMRSLVATGVCLLLAWITLSAGFGWPLPGGLESNARAASLVCLAGELTVFLLGLDILTSGVMSLLRGRPGAESLIVTAGLASVLDTVAVAAGNADRGLAFCVIPAAAMTFALWGAWYTGRGYYDSFMTFYHVGDPTCVSAEDLPEMDCKGLVTSRRAARGFIRRSEEPDPAESLASAAFIPMTAAALALALAAALGSRDAGAFFHILALMTGLCASFGWLFAYPVLFAKTSRHLMLEGAALAGWMGAREMGRSSHLLLRDTDIFPEDAMEITGIRILDRADTEKVISYTGSLLSTAGTGSAAVFTELMRIHKATFRTVEDFAVGEGGCRGTIDGSEVRIGTAGFMHLSAVKIPDKLKAEAALYTAVDGELAGVFLFRYRPLASVQRALFAMRKARRKPIFAIRDFNLDPMALRREFGVSTEGFRFPTFPERYKLSAAGKDQQTPAAGVLEGDDLEVVMDLCEWGGSLYRIGRICAWACLAGAVVGAVLMIAPCWTGNWAAASAAKTLLYMLAWTLPGIAGVIVLGR